VNDIKSRLLVIISLCSLVVVWLSGKTGNSSVFINDVTVCWTWLVLVS